MFCIVTDMVGACSRVARTRPGGSVTLPHDTARKGNDTAGPRAGSCCSKRARDLVGGGVAIQKLYRGWGGDRCVTIWRSRATTRQQRAATWPAIWPGASVTRRPVHVRHGLSLDTIFVS